MPEYDDKLLDHDYDGIKELDNDLPRWWVWLFILTIIWGFGYLIYYHVINAGYLQADEYRQEMDPNYVRVEKDSHYPLGLFEPYRSPYYAPEREMVFSQKSRKKTVFVEEKRETDTTTYLAITDQAQLSEGKTIFESKCVSCHGKFGEGNIGPNLTDDYWINGPGISNVVKTVKYGVPAKGMLAWRGDLNKEQIIRVASYVLKLHGTNPPNPKPPQGELVVESANNIL